jgi:hypothetical protein
MLSVEFLIKHANPISRVQAAARGAALREAAVQLERLQSLDLSSAEAHHRLVVRQWRRALRQVLGQRRT